MRGPWPCSLCAARSCICTAETQRCPRCCTSRPRSSRQPSGAASLRTERLLLLLLRLSLLLLLRLLLGRLGRGLLLRLWVSW